VDDSYNSKKAYKLEARRNGLRVIDILTDKEISDIKHRRILPVSQEMDLLQKYRDEIVDYIDQVADDPVPKAEPLDEGQGRWVTIHGARVFIGADGKPQYGSMKGSGQVDITEPFDGGYSITKPNGQTFEVFTRKKKLRDMLADCFYEEYNHNKGIFSDEDSSLWLQFPDGTQEGCSMVGDKVPTLSRISEASAIIYSNPHAVAFYNANLTYDEKYDDWEVDFN